MADDIRRNPATPPLSNPMIPGERDPGNLTHREPGAVGGQFTGGDIPDASPDWLDEVTARERAREGGGADEQRRRSTTHRPERASAD